MTVRDPPEHEPQDASPMRWVIGDWTVTPENGEVQRGSDAPIHVAPKHLAVLVLLAQNAGECVSRQQLIDAVWTRQFVQDDVLTRIIADLRKLLGQASDQDTYIVTVPKRGYRLVAPVRQLRVSRVTPIEIVHTGSEARALEVTSSDLSPASDESVDAPAAALRAPANAASEPVRRWWPGARLVLLLGMVTAGLWFVSQALRSPTLPAADLAESLRSALPAVAGPEYELMPRWIDDGHAFVYVEADPGRMPTRIMQFDLDRRDKTVLIDDGYDNTCPMMSPDAKQLVWTRLTKTDCQLMLKLMPNGPTTVLAACDQLAAQGCPSFSANGEDILFTAPGEAPGAAGRLVRQNLLRGTRTEALPRDFASGWTPVSPRESPDGYALAFELTQHPPVSRIMLQQADGAIKQILLAAHDHHGLAWSPTGNTLLVSSNALQFPGFVQLDGSAELPPRLLGFRGARHPDVSRSGAVLYEQHQYQINLWAMRPNDSAPTRLTDSQYHDAWPRISPDGDWVLFSSNRSGLEAIWLIERQSAQLHAVGLPADQRWLRPTWSLQPRQLTATRFQDGAYQTCLLNWAQAKPECPESLQAVVQAAELAPGEYMLERERDRSHQLFWLRRDRSEQLIAANVRRWRAAGGRVVFSDEDGLLHLWTRQADGTSKLELINQLTPGPYRRFSLDASRLCWLDAVDTSAHLYCRNLDHSGEDVLLFSNLPLGILDFDLSPAGDWLVFERTVRVQVDLFAARSGSDAAASDRN